MRDSKTNYIVVGAFVLVMVTALILWIGMLSGRTGATEDYYIVFGNVRGLKSGVEILFEGFPVGLIEDIQALPGEPVRFRVDVSVKEHWPIPEDSEAVISAGLFSAAVIDIRGGESSTSLKPGSQIPSSEAGDAFAAVGNAASRASEVLEGLQPAVASLKERVPEITGNVAMLTDKLDTTVDQVNKMLAEENVDRVGRILATMDKASTDANEIIGDLSTTRANIDAMIGKVDRMLQQDKGDLAVAVAELRYSLATLSRHVDAISANLETTTRNMNEFSRQVRDNPGVLLRGRESGDGQ
jgi:phospholipid/cholesterol/gamma-HCH transport system substrate-binding protein